MDDKIKNSIDSVWSKNVNSRKKEWWWECKPVIKYINKIICGEEAENLNDGAIKLLKSLYPGRIYNNAISIGAGICSKEIRMVENGLVNHYDIYELSKKRIEKVKQLIERKNLSKNFNIYNEDYFSIKDDKLYDLFFWDNSLHHMMDCRKAVKTSYEKLKYSGVFYCNDFIGESRFQWSDMKLLIVNAVRSRLDKRFFGKNDKKNIERIDKDFLIKKDPSEAADSDSIMPAINEYFPDAKIIYLGGLIYHICLDGIIVRINDEKLMSDLLKLDYEASKHGFNNYALVIANKK